MKKLFFICSLALVIAACGGKVNSSSTETSGEAGAETAGTTEKSDYDPNRGEGKFTEVKLEEKLDHVMADRGKQVADLKCTSCHKLTDEKLVGPGWAGVTSRHKAEWIMNFMTNTDVMIDKDPKVQAMLEICMVRMPNQSLTDENARDILEYLRKNDGVK
ncbi:Cytochrome c [Pedobacter steynii]|uniref:Cytochrome c n=1 Tax=Pedobacter steynii TaxID=430522 RepID=A0A1G9U6C8_9SPHI|nr:cytochrome c [Pedobacter steynii]NQX40670.1 cytochrome c [Pedobacter steynii]SDM55412.1 Cytochrome c [Pedobacter steynii]